jgi:serine/threonine-protein kinase
MAASAVPQKFLVVGAYELVRPLGEGGMGRVFLARHRSTGEQAVVKLMHEDRARDPAFRRLFRAELGVLARFRHRHAVALLDASREEEPQPYLVLEYVPGINLDDLLRREGRLSPNRVGALLGPLCVVLQAAHDLGILHRDITAANLMIIAAGTDRETIKVMDFGLARLGGFYVAMEKLQGDSDSIGGGTPDYVCPEQVRGEEVDARSDLYSVGVLLFRALTGHLPFESAREVQEILLAHCDQAPPRFADVGVRGVPPAIEAVVRACLAKHPSERPQSARVLAERYGEALGRPIVDPGVFAGAPVPPSSGGERGAAFPPEALIDRFEAWMPEQVAAMKLRGFIEGVGGEVIESVPGLIRVRLRVPSGVSAAPRGFWGWFRTALPVSAPVETIELHLQKKPVGGRNLVDIAVVRQARRGEARDQREARRDFCREICRELRAYLMIGR